MARGDITVQDIARRIARDGEDQQTLIERIRHWTRERLLVTSAGSWTALAELGGLHPGTGRYRTYDEEAVCRAAVLNALTREGATVRRLRMVIDWLDELEGRRERRGDVVKVSEAHSKRIADHYKTLWALAKARKSKGKRIMMVLSADGRGLGICEGLDEVEKWLEAMSKHHQSILTIINLELLAWINAE